MRLKYQLFFTLLLSSGLLIALMYAVNSWSFNRGFLSYINSTEIAKLQPMISELSEGYQTANSWDWITADSQQWLMLLDKHWHDLSNEGPRTKHVPSRRPDESPDSLPPGSIHNELPQPQKGPPPPPGRSPPLSNTLTLEPKLLLANVNYELLIGGSKNQSERNRIRWLPITHADETLGYLGYRQLRQLPGQLDQLFAAQQKRSYAYAAMAMVVLSGLLAAVLTSRIARPVQDMDKAVDRIGQGDYKHRIDSSRRDEIGDLSRNINRLATTLDKNQDSRQQWLAEISHELRTPVAILQSELEALIDGVSPINDAAINSLHDESLRLSRLINDLHNLTLSDIGALDYHFETLNIATLLTDRCQIATNKIRARSIVLETNFSDITAMIRGDRQRLEQLADNLMQNSIRYTDTGGMIRITLNAKPDNIDIIWEDSSPGVKDSQLALLFDPLFRTDSSRNRATGGAGLGLAIVKKIVEAHEGSISTHHSALGGLALHLRLPLQHINSL